MNSAIPTDIPHLLANAGAHRRHAEDERRVASRHLREAVEIADAAKMSKTEIAKLAGISRQTVHEMLKD